jgi:hypothetical protein
VDIYEAEREAALTEAALSWKEEETEEETLARHAASWELKYGTER